MFKIRVDPSWLSFSTTNAYDYNELTNVLTNIIGPGPRLVALDNEVTMLRTRLDSIEAKERERLTLHEKYPHLKEMHEQYITMATLVKDYHG